MRNLAHSPALRGLLAAILVVGLATLLPRFHLFLAGQLALVIIATVGMTLLMGGAGLLSLASAAFFALGSYGNLIIAARTGLPMLASAVLTVALCFLLGALVGLIALRLSGFFLAIVTFGFVQVLGGGLKRGGALTGGGYGLVAPDTRLPGLGTLTTSHIALLAIFLMVLAVACGVAIMHGRIGRAWLALRDNDAAARMLGMNVTRLRVLAFALASAFIAAAGTLHPLLLGVANPGSYTVDLSIFHITLVIVGGMTGSMIGAVIAPVILFYLPEALSFLGEYRDFFYAFVLILALAVMPQGISPVLLGLWRRYARRAA